MSRPYRGGSSGSGHPSKRAYGEYARNDQSDHRKASRVSSPPRSSSSSTSEQTRSDLRYGARLDRDQSRHERRREPEVPSGRGMPASASRHGMHDSQTSSDGEKRHRSSEDPQRSLRRGEPASAAQRDSDPRKTSSSSRYDPSKSSHASSSSLSSNVDAGRTQPEDDADLTFELEDEEEEQRRIEEQRRKRKELMNKLSSVSSSSTSSPAPPAITPSATHAASKPQEKSRTTTPAPRTRESDADFDLVKGAAELPGPKHSLASSPGAGMHAEDISAADYDPSLDRKLDEEREQRRLQRPAKGQTSAASVVASGVGEPAERVLASPGGQHAEEDDESQYEEIEVEDEEDVDDMFAITDAAPRKKVVRVKKSKAAPGNAALAPAAGGALPSHAGLTDNWDDPEGYYRIVLGEHIGPQRRYHVFANLGKGMFSEVVRAKDLGEDGKGRGDREVAIKIVRSQETMYKAGLKELSILDKLAGMDPEDKRHLVRLISHFEHRGHLCMVFESLSMNLRDVVKRFGKDVGLNLRAVRAYAHQLFLALALMRKAEIMHADLKPDNILVNEAKTQLKVCDLGSASDLSEMEITPYLVSRFYRAPEIILGQAYDCSLDVWSIGCTLYELYTGKILFPGRTNNQMLLLIQELKGKFTTRQIRKGRFSGQHFDETNTFLSYEKDKNTGAETVRKVVLSTTPTPDADLRARLLPANVAKSLPDDELRLTQHFVDLLGRTLELDPAKRITPAEALRHPFLA